MRVFKQGYTGDLTLPLMAVRNAYASATFSSGSGKAVAARSPQTYSFWQPESLPEELEAGGVAQINYIACYVREGNGATIQPEYLDGSVWIPFGPAVQPDEAGSFLWLDDAIDVDAIRLSVSDGAPKVANFKAGLADGIPVGLPVGYEPAKLNPQDQYTNIVSQRGQILGSNLERTGSRESLQFRDVDQSYRDTWLAIREALRTEAVYFAWNGEDFPAELVYAMVSGTPGVSYSQGLYLNISVDLEGPDAGLR